MPHTVLIAAALMAWTAAGRPDHPTFTREVAPILFARCAACHRPGEVGPFALLSYADASKHAARLAQAAGTRAMPPWLPLPGHGEFLDDRRLTDAQVAVLQQWAANGGPEGYLEDLPRAPKFAAPGWRLGKPDLVLTPAKPYAVPTSGRSVSRLFVLPLHLTGDRCVRAVEIRPGNPRVVLSAIALLDGSGMARRLEAKQTDGPGYPGDAGPGFIPSGVVASYVPGQPPRPYPTDAPLTLHKGTDLVLLVRYDPAGQPETDQPQVGLYFTDRKPKRMPAGVLLGTAAGDPAPTVTDTFVLPADLEVADIWPHLPAAAKSVHAWAELPDGSKRELLKIAEWAPAGSELYRFAKPFRLPRGTKVKAEFGFDPAKPAPAAGLWLGGLAQDWQDEISLLAANVGHRLELAAAAEKPKAKP